MKILWICRKYFDEALDRSAWLEMTERLESFGDCVTIITGYRHRKKKFDLDIRYVPSIKVRFLNFLSFEFLGYFHIAYLISKEKPDIVILDPWTFWFSFPFDLLSKFRFINTKFFTYTNFYPHRIYFQLYFLYCKYLHSGMTTVSSFMKRQVEEQFKFPNDRIIHWTDGVSLKRFNPNSSVQANKSIKQAIKGKFVLMYHGSFTPNRELTKVIKAVNFLKNEYPEIVFICLGDGPSKGDMISLVNKLGLQNNFVLKEAVSHKRVPAYLRLCDVGIMAYPDITFWRVSSPIKLMEYLAMKKPVIVRDIIAFRDVIDSQPCGIFIDSNEPHEIAQAIEYAYRNRDKLAKWGEIGRNIVKEGFTWKQQAHKLRSFLEEAVER